MAKNATVEQLYRKYQNVLVSYLAKQYSADVDLAQEIVQEVFISVKKHVDKGGNIDNEKALIFKIAKNKMIDYRRRRGNQLGCHVPLEEELFTSDAPNQEQLLIQHQQLDMLEQVILQLPPRCQEVFVLRVFENKKHEEISEICGISKSMVEKHLCKAFKRIRQETEII